MEYQQNIFLESKEIVCVKLKEGADEFLIGIIEAADKEGVVLLNLDYRGSVTGHVYMSERNIVGYIDASEYIKKIMLLCDNQLEQEHFITFPKDKDIKNYFLEWIYNNNKLFRLTFQDEQIDGYIYEIDNQYVVLRIIDKITGEGQGYSIIYKKKLLDIICWIE